jgi:diacylglycerol kinase (ATP)
LADVRKISGLRRLVRSCRVSFAGFVHGVRHEAAIREVMIGGIVLDVLALLLPVARLEQLILVLSVSLVVLVEFLNSAIESAVDRISTEHNPLSGLAKDYANVAVVIAVIMMGIAWFVIAGPVALDWMSR